MDDCPMKVGQCVKFVGDMHIGHKELYPMVQPPLIVAEVATPKTTTCLNSTKTTAFCLRDTKYPMYSLAMDSASVKNGRKSSLLSSLGMKSSSGIPSTSTIIKTASSPKQTHALVGRLKS